MVDRNAKRPKNLLLPPDAVARGERFSRLRGTSLSRLVSDFLRALPIGDGDEGSAPQVERLRGLLKAGGDRQVYRDHLVKKYRR